jgi:outer membrane lipoprotein carrier protein
MRIRSFVRALTLAAVTFGAAVAAPLASPGVAMADPPAAPSPPPSTDQAVANVQAFYDSAHTFRAAFTQKFWVKAYNQTKDSRGQVVFKKPGKMRWTYDDPAGNVVVSDGSQLEVYEAANKQMYIQQVNASQYPAALSFLTGGGKLTDTFDFEMYGGDRMHFPGGYVLVGTPKQASPAYTKVLFYVDSGTSQVRRVMVIDGQGNRNRFDFDQPHINENVDDGAFVYHPPEGTTIIH